MGRTIPSFRIAAILEEKTWKQYRKYLNKIDRTEFDKMFSIATLYNSASSYAAIPIRLHPIMISLVFYHYKTLKGKNCNILLLGFNDLQIDNDNNSTILHKDLEKYSEKSLF
jgi:hypothetical protein